MVAASALSIRPPTSGHPINSNIRTPERITAAGFTMSLSAYFWSGAVGGLEDSVLVAVVPAGSEAQPADLRRARIGKVVTVQIGCAHHLVFVRASQDLLQHRVRNPVVDQDLILPLSFSTTGLRTRCCN